MTTLEFFKKELHKCEVNLDKQMSRNAPEKDIENVREKLKHYSLACELLRKEGSI